MAGRGEGKGQEQCHSHSVSATADYESRWTSPGFVCGRIRTTWDMKPHRFRRSRLRFAGDARGGARRHQCLGGPADARPHPRADPGWPCDERCAAGAEHGGVLQGRLAARQRVRHGATQEADFHAAAGTTRCRLMHQQRDMLHRGRDRGRGSDSSPHPSVVLPARTAADDPGALRSPLRLRHPPHRHRRAAVRRPGRGPRHGPELPPDARPPCWRRSRSVTGAFWLPPIAPVLARNGVRKWILCDRRAVNCPLLLGRGATAVSTRVTRSCRDAGRAPLASRAAATRTLPS